MAQRFGGRYSPDGGGQPAGGPGAAGGGGAGKGPPPRPRFRVDPVGARANLLFLPPVLLAFLSFGGGPETLVLGLGGAALWVLAGWLTREGLRAEQAYHDRKVARPPALPRKILASLAIGLGTWAAGLSGDAGLVGGAIYGIVAAVLHLAAFGIDPLRAKGIAGGDSFQQDRVARAVDEAEAYLEDMTRAIRSTGDRPLQARVARFQDAAREMFRTVEQDPRDLTAARKYLSVYLMGARDATAKFAEIAPRSRDGRARDDYLALLDDLEQNFAARTEKMLLDERSDLTIEIDVLRDRLRREGVRS